MGEIISLNLGVPGKPAIILIQDAHSVTDAQKSIHRLIDYFVKVYGSRVIALEGGKGKLDASLFRYFPDPRIKKKIFGAYLHEGKLSGAELAAIFGGPETSFEGIEDWNLYEANYLAYLRAIRRQPAVLEKLDLFKSGLDSRRKEVYPAELNRIHEAREAFSSEKKNLAEYLKIISEYRSEDWPRRFPRLTGLLEALDKEKMAGGFSDSVRRLAFEFKKKSGSLERHPRSAEFHRRYQQLMTGSEDPAVFLKFLLGLSRRMKVPLTLSPAMRQAIGWSRRLASLKGTEVFDEIESAERAAEKKLARTPAAKSLRRDYERLSPLYDLVRLEMTPDEFSRLENQAAGRAVRFSARDLLEPFITFYRIALRRDGALFDRLMRRANEEQGRPVVAVVGGFHRRGLEKTMRERGMSYAVVNPRIRSLEGHQNYREAMRRPLFYEAFVKQASARLMAACPADARRRVLRRWRDDLIRAMVLRGSAGRARQYTRFIDPMAEPYSNQNETRRILREEIDRLKSKIMEDLWKNAERVKDRLYREARGKVRDFEKIGKIESALAAALGALSPGLDSPVLRRIRQDESMTDAELDALLGARLESAGIPLGSSLGEEEAEAMIPLSEFNQIFKDGVISPLVEGAADKIRILYFEEGGEGSVRIIPVAQGKEGEPQILFREDKTLARKFAIRFFYLTRWRFMGMDPVSIGIPAEGYLLVSRYLEERPRLPKTRLFREMTARQRKRIRDTMAGMVVHHSKIKAQAKPAYPLSSRLSEQHEMSEMIEISRTDLTDKQYESALPEYAAWTSLWKHLDRADWMRQMFDRGVLAPAGEGREARDRLRERLMRTNGNVQNSEVRISDEYRFRAFLEHYLKISLNALVNHLLIWQADGDLDAMEDKLLSNAQGLIRFAVEKWPGDSAELAAIVFALIKRYMASGTHAEADSRPWHLLNHFINLPGVDGEEWDDEWREKMAQYKLVQWIAESLKRPPDGASLGAAPAPPGRLLDLGKNKSLTFLLDPNRVMILRLNGMLFTLFYDRGNLTWQREKGRAHVFKEGDSWNYRLEGEIDIRAEQRSQRFRLTNRSKTPLSVSVHSLVFSRRELETMQEAFKTGAGYEAGGALEDNSFYSVQEITVENVETPLTFVRVKNRRQAWMARRVLEGLTEEWPDGLFAPLMMKGGFWSEELRGFIFPRTEGDSLRELYLAGDDQPARKRLAADAGEYLEIASRMARAASYMADRGYVHGDLRPANFNVDREGRLSLENYAFSIPKGEERKKETALGAFGYAPREQIMHGPAQLTDDVFSLSRSLSFLWQGAEDPEIFGDNRGSQPDLLAGNPLQKIILKGLHSNPKLRYKNIFEMAEAIDAARADYEAKAASLGADSIRALGELERQALDLRDTGDFQAAVRTWEEAKALALRIRGLDPARVEKIKEQIERLKTYLRPIGSLEDAGQFIPYIARPGESYRILEAVPGKGIQAVLVKFSQTPEFGMLVLDSSRGTFRLAGAARFKLDDSDTVTEPWAVNVAGMKDAVERAISLLISQGIVRRWISPPSPEFADEDSALYGGLRDRARRYGLQANYSAQDRAYSFSRASRPARALTHRRIWLAGILLVFFFLLDMAMTNYFAGAARSTAHFDPAGYAFEVRRYDAGLSRELDGGRVFYVSNINPYRHTEDGRKKAVGWVRIGGEEVSPFNPNRKGNAMQKAVGVIRADGTLEIHNYLRFDPARFPAGRYPFAFQAGPMAVEDGRVNAAVYDWYRGIFHGAVMVTGTDAGGEVKRKTFLGFDPFGVTGNTLEAFRKDFDAWVRDMGIRDAFFGDAGTAGIEWRHIQRSEVVLVARRKDALDRPAPDKPRGGSLGEETETEGPDITIYTHQGARQYQEDSFYSGRVEVPGIPGARGHLMIVADGHGEKGAGAEASLFAANNYPLYLKQALRETAGSAEAVKSAVRLAAARLGRDMKIFASGTTFSAVFIPDDEDTAYVAYVGDSPIRILSPDGDVTYESKPHNARAMDPVEREAYMNAKGLRLKNGVYFVGASGEGNQLYKSFGDRESSWMDFEPDVDAVALAEGSTVALASDGLLLDHDEQTAFLSFGTTARTLVEHAVDHLAEQGKADNATAILYVHRGRRISGSPTAEMPAIGGVDENNLVRPGMKFIDLLNAVKVYRDAGLPFPLAKFSELNGDRELEDFALENLREGTDLGEDTAWTALWEVLELYEALGAVPGAVRTRLTPIGKGRLPLGVALALESQGSWPGKAAFETDLRSALLQFEEIQRQKFGLQPPEDSGTEGASLGFAGDALVAGEVYRWLRSLGTGLRDWAEFRVWLEVKMRMWLWERGRQIRRALDSSLARPVFSDDLPAILETALNGAGEEPGKWSRNIEDAILRIRNRAFEAGMKGLHLDLAVLQNDLDLDLVRARLGDIRSGERIRAPEKTERHRLVMNFDRKNGRMLREILADYAGRLREVVLVYDRTQVPTKKEMSLWRAAVPAAVFRRAESPRDFPEAPETNYLFTEMPEFSRGLRAPMNVILARVDEIHNQTARRLALGAAVVILFLLADIFSGLGEEELARKREELLKPGSFRRLISSPNGLSFLGDWFAPGKDGIISLALNGFIQSLTTSEQSERTLSRAA